MSQFVTVIQKIHSVIRNGENADNAIFVQYKS